MLELLKSRVSQSNQLVHDIEESAKRRARRRTLAVNPTSIANEFSLEHSPTKESVSSESRPKTVNFSRVPRDQIVSLSLVMGLGLEISQKSAQSINFHTNKNDSSNPDDGIDKRKRSSLDLAAMLRIKVSHILELWIAAYHMQDFEDVAFAKEFFNSITEVFSSFLSILSILFN